jgi:hypothetical protein
MNELRAVSKNQRSRNSLAIVTMMTVGILLNLPALLGNNAGAQNANILTTATPVMTPHQIYCTPPACQPGEVYHCPASCPGGCGLVCATPTTVSTNPTVTISSPLSVHAPSGGLIELRVQFPRDGIDFQWQELWTIVQWQDEFGHWHNVEGWQGSLDKVTEKNEMIVGRKTWWLASDLFGKGPFRWMVYRVQKGKLVGESESFYLGECPGKTVIVETTLIP